MAIDIETIFDLIFTTDEEYEKEFGHKKFENPKPEDPCLGCAYNKCSLDLKSARATALINQKKENLIIRFFKWICE